MNEDETIELLKSRSSVRNFSDEDIPKEILNEILEAGLRAPSAGNRQPWRIFVVKGNTKKRKLAEAAYGQHFVSQAPVTLVICAVPSESAQRYGQRGRELYSIQDTAALTYGILLAAHFKGYAGCWVGAFDENAVSEVLDLSQEFRPVSIIPLGKGTPKTKASRKSLSEVVIEID
ncbi:MAG: nitroreductase family protein [Candidatus Thorarchaeota archaeon]|nr:nitroreductase family protein [Candidatus Thorarchaeota archaeon]